jgi:hypothetical protein
VTVLILANVTSGGSVTLGQPLRLPQDERSRRSGYVGDRVLGDRWSPKDLPMAANGHLCAAQSYSRLWCASTSFCLLRCSYPFTPALAYGTLAYWSVRYMGALGIGATTTKPIPRRPHALTDHLALAFSPLRLRHAPFGALLTPGTHPRLSCVSQDPGLLHDALSSQELVKCGEIIRVVSVKHETPPRALAWVE